MSLNFYKKLALFVGTLIILYIAVLHISPRVSDKIASALHRYGLDDLSLVLIRNDSELAFDIGMRNFEVDAYDTSLAEKAFQKTVSLQPDKLFAHYQLARVLFVEGKLEDALIAISKELQYHPNNLRSLYVRGLIYAYSDRLSLAEADFKNFVAWVPTEWAGYNDLAWILAQEGKYEEAEAVLEEAFEKAHGANTNPWLWNTLGVQQLNLRNLAGARVSFEKASALAAALTEREWRMAYPGNHPATVASGLEAFRSAIQENLQKTQEAL